MFESWERGDVDAMLEHVAEDVEWNPSVWSGAGQHYTGHAGVRRWASQFAPPGRRLTVRATQYRQGPTAVAVIGEVTEIRDDVSASSVDVGWVFEVAEGKVTRGEGFSDPSRALRLAGVWE
jgi:ketosteroid isomerase-like protein